MLNALEATKRHKQLQLEGCPECASEELVTDQDSGEVICSKCGLVIKEVMFDRKPEWRAFTLEERKTMSRVGAPISLSQYDKGLSTTFKPGEKVSGRHFSSETRLKMMRLRKWQVRSRIHSSIERNLSQAMTELNRLADKLHIPKPVREEAALIYRKALSEGLVRGRSILSIVAASLYAACRLTGTPRSLKELIKASARNEKEISRFYRLIQRSLNMEMPIDDPVKYVPKIGSKLSLEQKTQNHAISILREAWKRDATTGKGPVGIAAAALYVAALLDGKDITQKELAGAAGVTEVTVRNRYKGLRKSLDLGKIIWEKASS